MKRSEILRKANAIIAQLADTLNEGKDENLLTADCNGADCNDSEVACQVATEDDSLKDPNASNASLTASIKRLEARIAAEEENEEKREAKSVMASIKRLEARIAAEEENNEKEANGSCCNEDNDGCCKKSCKKAAVEDEIGDEAHGGDPSVSELPKLTDINVDTLEGITASIDKIATALEMKGFKKLAFRLDQVSDKLENFK